MLGTLARRSTSCGLSSLGERKWNERKVGRKTARGVETATHLPTLIYCEGKGGDDICKRDLSLSFCRVPALYPRAVDRWI